MSDSGLAIFETPIGACGLAWHAERLVGVLLPGRDPARTLARLRERHPGLEPAQPPDWVKQAIGRIGKLLSGEKDDLLSVPVDWSRVSAFEASVLREARNIRPGEILTYGELAARIGEPGEARAVGQALGRNPWPIVVPCHRVTAASGRTGGFSAPGGVSTKLRLLEIEGALSAERLPLFASPN